MFLRNVKLLRGGFTLAEVLIAMPLGLMVLAVVTSTSVTLQRSIAATQHYAKVSNDGSRLLDYVVQDLRRAVGVGTLVGSTHQPLKNNASVTVSETNTLTVNIPDYYQSSTPSRDPASGFRNSRYDRDKLNVLPTFNGNGAAPLNGSIYWKEAVTKVGSVETIRFAPSSAGTGQIQVRYYRAPRSATDATACFFRAEYKIGAGAPNFPPEEIAERLTANGDPVTVTVTAPNLPVTDRSYGKILQVSSSFIPRFRRSGPEADKVQQYLTVVLRNARRD